MATNWHNKLYFGDNLEILRDYVPDESVDLIYLDPPFNSKATYSVLFKEKNGTASAAQVAAFEDTWHWDMSTEGAFREVVTGGGPSRTSGHGKIGALLDALRQFLGSNDMMAYLVMMAIRLIELHRVLKPTGSIYLHCDPTASHYLKLILDAVFGADNFRTEIAWKRSSAHSDARQGRRQHGRIHDVVLFYTKTGSNYTWNQLFTPYDPEYIEHFYRHVEPDTGRRYRLSDITAPGGAAPEKRNPKYEFLGTMRYWRFSKERMKELYDEGRIIQTRPGSVPCQKRYLDEMPGVPLQDIWSDIKPIGAQAAERLGYPTQKPEALLERIIQASSNEGDLVLDPFCGCGTTIAVAERLHRRWIGIDITHLAITLMKNRLEDAFGAELSPYEVIGEPKDVQSAAALAEQNRYQFEWWALGLVDARPAQDKKKGADKGVDGEIVFFDDDSGKAKKVIVQVKSGHVTRQQIAALKSDMEREKAAVAAFITLHEPTGPMKKEAAEAGFYDPPGLLPPVPRVQILTIEELLAGRKLEYPRIDVATFKKAPRKRKAKRSQ